MFAKFFFSILFFLCLTFSAFATDLNVIRGKVYLMSFDEEIQNIHTDENKLEAQILHTIFDDRKSIIISLKSTSDAILQVKTDKNIYNYNVKDSNKASDVLLEIDIPPLENLNVDVYSGV